jgi:hypothetical protein
MRAVIPFIVTVLLVCLLAPLLGTLFLGLLTGTPQLVISRDLAGVPVLLYAALAALPVALPAVLIVAVSATVFGYSVGRRQSYWVWAVLFSTIGLFLGLFCASPLILASAQESTIDLAMAWVFLGAACGAAVMGLLSGLWYFFFRVL